MIRKDVYLTEKQIKRLQKEAKTTGLSFADVIRRIVDAHFKEKDKNK